MGITFSGLKNFNNFKSKLDKLNSNNLANTLSESIAERGAEIAKSKYTMSVTVYSTPAFNGESRVTAEMAGLAYIEYGTGEKGRSGNYQGNLKIEHSFNAPYPVGASTPMQLSEWTYSYANKYFNAPKFNGQAPQAQMYNTMKELQNEVEKKGINIIKGGTK